MINGEGEAQAASRTTKKRSGSGGVGQKAKKKKGGKTLLKATSSSSRLGAGEEDYIIRDGDIDFEWSEEAEALFELGRSQPWLLDTPFVLNHFKTLAIVDKGREGSTTI